MTLPMVAALYVEEGGVYYGLEGVDPWPESRDARKYAGPYPVVAHPPCERWGRFWHGSPSKPGQFSRGDDGGCFAQSLRAVYEYGGVIEHPAHSFAFRAFGLPEPPRDGGWVTSMIAGGWSCCVDQGHYGHAAPKPTWLFASRVSSLPSLIWGPSGAAGRVELQSHNARRATPPAVRDLLLSIARSARLLEKP